MREVAALTKHALTMHPPSHTVTTIHSAPDYPMLKISKTKTKTGVFFEFGIAALEPSKRAVKDIEVLWEIVLGFATLDLSSSYAPTHNLTATHILH